MWKAMAAWKWHNFLESQAPAGRRVVRINMDESPIKFDQVRQLKGLIAVPKQEFKRKSRNYSTEGKPCDAQVCYHSGRIYLRRRCHPENPASGNSGKPQAIATKGCRVASIPRGLNLCAVKKIWLERFQIAMRDFEVARALVVPNGGQSLVCDESGCTCSAHSALRL